MRSLSRLLLGLILCALMGACAAPTVTVRTGVPAGQSRGNDRATEQFTAVARQVEPVANDVCRQIRPRSNCDFLILIDERQGLPVNAFQTTDRRGRPYLVFTRAIVDEFRNADEMAFVISHEAAHHIENHLYERAQSAQAAEVIFEAAAAASGASVAGQATAAEYGRLIGSRVYSKQFELEADALGTVIAKRAGFDPVRGAMFFARLPDPGDQFLGTHPPNAARIGVVQQVAAQLP